MLDVCWTHPFVHTPPVCKVPFLDAGGSGIREPQGYTTMYERDMRMNNRLSAVESSDELLQVRSSSPSLVDGDEDLLYNLRLWSRRGLPRQRLCGIYCDTPVEEMRKDGWHSR